MKLISWNVNGLRACIQKGFLDFFHETDADIFCIQESKLQEGQIDLPLPGYFSYWNYAKKKGYSGTAIFTKKEPLNVTYGIGIEEHDKEGRVITLEYPDFYMVTCYTPNSQNELARLPYRMQWEDDFRTYVGELKKKKPVIIHFLGDERPWIGGNHNHYGKWYRKYLDMTPWKDMPMQKGKFWYMQLWWCFNQMTRLCPALRLAISRRLGMKVIDNRKKSQGK